MSIAFDLSRRMVLTASVVLPYAAGVTGSVAVTSGGAPGPRSDILVAYFSRTGNTRVIARQVQRALGTDLFEIEPSKPYPEDYEETVEQARRERDAGVKPSLKAAVPDFTTYRTVFLGFPIWGTTAPPVIRSFLSSHDWAGKTLRPFITHGGYGLGSSISVLASHAPRSELIEPLAMEADQERRTLAEVTAWIGGIERP